MDGSRLEAWLLRNERRLLSVNLALVLLTAWTSLTYFHEDEHWQVVEFTSLKLGLTAPADMPWEYAAQIRPWLQPLLYFLVLKPLLAVGLSDRFVLAFVLRLVSGLFSFGALVALLRASAGWFRAEHAGRFSLRLLTLAGCVPYLAVRTSSENASAGFLLLGLAVLMRGLDPEARASSRISARQLLAAGVSFGMAFECRFQVAFAIVGVALWLGAVARIGIRAFALFALGLLAPVIGALFVDRWGYGAWVFPPWSYARVNLLEGKAAEFGTKWFGAYLHITLANIFAPLVILALAGLALCWVRRPRHIVTFTTLPFILGHSLVGHKEERFLLPIFSLGLVGAALGLELGANDVQGAAQRFALSVARWFAAFRASFVYRLLLGWNLFCLVLLTVYPLGWRAHLSFAEWIYRHVRERSCFIFQDPTIRLAPAFYRRENWSVLSEDALRAGELPPPDLPVYWVRHEPFTALDASLFEGAPPLVFSEFPGSSSDWFRQRAFATLGSLHRWLLAIGWQPKRAVWLSAYRVDARVLQRVLRSAEGERLAFPMRR